MLPDIEEACLAVASTSRPAALSYWPRPLLHLCHGLASFLFRTTRVNPATRQPLFSLSFSWTCLYIRRYKYLSYLTIQGITL